MNHDLSVLIYSVICGVLMGVIYEALRIIRVTVFPFKIGKQISEPKRLPAGSAETAILLLERDCKEKAASVVLTAICDILFGVISGICAAVLLFHTNNGEIRWFAMMGCAIGFSAYMLTLGKIVLRIYVKVKALVFKVIKKILSLILAPIIIPLKATVRVLRKRIIKRRAKKTLLKLLKENSKENERDSSESDNCEGEGAVFTS